MRDKYLYFGLDSAASESFDNTDCSGAVTLTLNTSNFDDPTPDGINFIANGGLKVEVVANASHTFGTSYADVNTTAGVTVDITRSCTYHATTGAISITLVASDAVDGFTGHTSDANANDFTVTQLKPYLTGNGYVYNSRYLQGMHYESTTTTELHFQGKTGDLSDTGDASDVDTITVTHGLKKHKEFMQELLDVIADDNKVNGMVIVCDDMPTNGSTTLTTQNASAIASVAQTATAS
tara:strand:+ start:58 stop:768 length:711 start_codon:yes stop_codon:yes gene_type:complete